MIQAALGFLIVAIGVLVLLSMNIPGFSQGAPPNRHRSEFIDGYQFDEGCDKRLAALRPELARADRAAAWDGLREYFQLFHASKFATPMSMPSQLVDDAWHCFIVDTKLYSEFCTKAFSRFLHHTPEMSPMPVKDRKRATLTLPVNSGTYRWALKTGMPTAREMPMIFALDAVIGLADGFEYTMPATGALKPDRGDSISGSGCSGWNGHSGHSDGGSHGGHASSGDGGGASCGGGGCGGD